MSIKIGVSPSLQSLTNNMAVVEVNGSTIGECLAHLINMFPGIKNLVIIRSNKLFGPIGIYVNRDQNFTRELDKSVEDGEELYMLHTVTGG